MATTSTTRKTSKKHSFKWTPEMVENLAELTKYFKASMTFKHLDFDADKAAQYSAVHETMAAIYCDDETLFGSAEAPNWPENFGQLLQEDRVTVKKEIKIQKELIVKGKGRIQEKKKEIRQYFSKAVVSGSRRGSGILVYEHYENLVSIWAGCANIESLSIGISSGQLDDEYQEFSADLDVQEDNNNEHIDNNQDESDSDPDVDTGNNSQTSMPANTEKRKVNGSIVPRLINNKRKQLERNLSAAQRDDLFMEEMKNDAEFRKDLLQIVRESNDCFSNSVKEISKSMSDLSKGLCASVELLSRAIASQPQPQFPQAPFHPNVIYQNLNRYSPTVSQQQGYYAQMIAETRSSQSQNPKL